MDNIVTKEGATLAEIYRANNTYLNVAAEINEMQSALTTDLETHIWRVNNKVKKALKDASGQYNTPKDRVFFADNSGQATSDANFTFNGSKLMTPVPAAEAAGLPVVYRAGGLESRTVEQFNNDIGKLSTVHRLTTHWRFREINNGENLVLEYSTTGDEEGEWIPRREF